MGENKAPIDCPSENESTVVGSYADALTYLTPSVQAFYHNDDVLGPCIKSIAKFDQVGEKDCPFTYDFEALRRTLGACIGRYLMCRIWGSNSLEYHLNIDIRHTLAVESPSTKKIHMVDIVEPFETIMEDILYSDTVEYIYERLSDQLDSIENHLDDISDKEYTLENFQLTVIYDLDPALQQV